MFDANSVRRFFETMQSYGVIVLNAENGRGQNFILPGSLATLKGAKTYVATISELESGFLRKLAYDAYPFLKGDKLENKLTYGTSSRLLKRILKHRHKKTSYERFPFDVLVLDQFDEMEPEQLMITMIWASLVDSGETMPRLVLLISDIYYDEFVQRQDSLNIINSTPFLESVPYFKSGSGILENNSIISDKVDYYSDDFNIPSVEGTILLLNEVVDLKTSNLFYEKGDIAVIVKNSIEAKMLKDTYLESFPIQSPEVEQMPYIFTIESQQDLFRVYGKIGEPKKKIFIGTTDFGRLVSYFPNIRYVLDFCQKETKMQDENFNETERQLGQLSRNAIEKNGCIHSKFGTGIHYRMISRDQYRFSENYSDNGVRFGPAVKSMYVSFVGNVSTSIFKQNLGSRLYGKLTEGLSGVIRDFRLNPKYLDELFNFVSYLDLEPYNSIFLYAWIAENRFDPFTGMVMAMLLEKNVSIFDVPCQIQMDRENSYQYGEQTLGGLRSENNPLQTLLNFYLYFESELYSLDPVTSGRFNFALVEEGVKGLQEFQKGREILQLMINNFSLSESRLGDFFDSLSDLKRKYAELRAVHKRLPAIEDPYIVRDERTVSSDPESMSNNLMDKFEEIMKPHYERSDLLLRRHHEDDYVRDESATGRGNLYRKIKGETDFWAKDFTINFLLSGDTEPDVWGDGDVVTNAKEKKLPNFIYPVVSKKMQINGRDTFEVSLYIPKK